MTKKILILFLTILISFLVVGCKKGSSSKENKENNDKQEEQGNTDSKQNQDDNNDDNPDVGPIDPVVEHYSVSYYDNYYSEIVSWTDGEDLKQQLNAIISGGTYKALSYTVPNYETNIDADHTDYDFEYLDVLYSSDDVLAKYTNTKWQREHCFPASLMTGSTTSNATSYLGRATDFHNLWASNASANSSRGNKNYGVPDVNSLSYKNNMSEDGYDGYRADASYFEPGDKDKGIVARSIFYMATMYITEEYDTKNNVLMKGLTIVEDSVEYVEGNDCSFAIGGLSLLLSWNSFPVSDLEAQHNESVYSHVYSKDGYAQGNRNPYVDFPELVDYVFGDKKDEPGYMDELTPSIVSLGRAEEGVHNYAISSALRVYNYGEAYDVSDVQIVAINNDFSTSVINEGVESSYQDYEFSSADGVLKSITVSYLENDFTYVVDLKQYGQCNFKESFSKTMFDNSKINTPYTLTIGDMKFDVIVSGTSGFSLTNNNKQGGIKLGSGTKAVTKICLTSQEIYSLDAIFIDSYAANKDSSFDIKISIGDDTIYSSTIKNGTDYTSYGNDLSQTYTGKIKIDITGTNALYLYLLSINFVEE